jgi:hypothetical protein
MCTYKFVDVGRALRECKEHPSDEWKLAVLGVVLEGFKPSDYMEELLARDASAWLEDHRL